MAILCGLDFEAGLLQVLRNQQECIPGIVDGEDAQFTPRRLGGKDIVHHLAQGLEIDGLGYKTDDFLAGKQLLAFLGQDASYSAAGAIMLIGSLLALAASGSISKVSTRDSTFNPVAFKRLLTTSTTLSLCDMMGLLIFGGLSMEIWGQASTGGLLLAFAGLMGAAVYGLTRMKFWGFALNIIANFAIAGVVALRGSAANLAPHTWLGGRLVTRNPAAAADTIAFASRMLSMLYRNHRPVVWNGRGV